MEIINQMNKQDDNKVKIRPFRYGNSSTYLRIAETMNVKIRPFRYGNVLQITCLWCHCIGLKSDRFGMEIFL